jgi:hypothetical protein
MPAILKDKKQYLVSKVRSIIAQDHQITLDELAQRRNDEAGKPDHRQQPDANGH